MTCPYITSLERACGRPSTCGDYCPFHGLLFLYEQDNGATCKSLPQRIAGLREAARPLMRRL